jgi:hypothetical protein
MLFASQPALWKTDFLGKLTVLLLDSTFPAFVKPESSYLIHINPLLCQINPLHALPSYSLRVKFNNILLFIPRLSKQYH